MSTMWCRGWTWWPHLLQLRAASSTSWWCAWCPMAVPAYAGVWVLVCSLHFSTLRCTWTKWAPCLYGLWACCEDYHPRGGGDPWAAPEWCVKNAIHLWWTAKLKLVFAWHYLAMVYRDIDFCVWSEDDYSRHYLLEKQYWRALGCFTPLFLTFGSTWGWDISLLWWFLGGFVLCFVWVCCFGFVFGFELSHSLVFTQKLWSFQVSVEGHWTCSWTYVLVRRVSWRLFMPKKSAARYPRDLLQPARKSIFTTVLGVRRSLFALRVASATWKIAFHHSFGRQTITFCVKGRSATWKICISPQFWTSDEHEVTRVVSRRDLPNLPCGKEKKKFYRGAAFSKSSGLSSSSQQIFSAVFLSSSSQQLFSAALLSSSSQQPFSAALLSSSSQQLFSAALLSSFLSSFSQQPFSAALISSLSQQLFSAAFLSSLSQQLFSAALLSRFFQQLFSAALLSSYSQQPFSAALLSSSSQLSSCCGQGLVVS